LRRDLQRLTTSGIQVLPSFAGGLHCGKTRTQGGGRGLASLRSLQAAAPLRHRLRPDPGPAAAASPQPSGCGSIAAPPAGPCRTRRGRLSAAVRLRLHCGMEAICARAAFMLPSAALGLRLHCGRMVMTARPVSCRTLRSLKAAAPLRHEGLRVHFWGRMRPLSAAFRLRLHCGWTNLGNGQPETLLLSAAVRLRLHCGISNPGVNHSPQFGLRSSQAEVPLRMAGGRRLLFPAVTLSAASAPRLHCGRTSHLPCSSALKSPRRSRAVAPLRRQGLRGHLLGERHLRGVRPRLHCGCSGA
jgi:hypothetical protein